MQKQAAGLAVYPDLAKIAPGAIAQIDAQFGSTTKEQPQGSQEPKEKVQTEQESPAEPISDKALPEPQAALPPTCTDPSFQLPFMLVDDFASQQQQSNAITSENKDPQLNFTTVNGVQYISVVDERNRRGRPPKAKKDDMQDEPMAPNLHDD